MVLAVVCLFDRLPGFDRKIVERRRPCWVVCVGGIRGGRRRRRPYTTRAERGAQRGPCAVADDDDIDGVSRLVILQRVRHVVEVLDACPADLDDAVAALDAGLVRGRAATHVRQQHAARRGIHRGVIRHRAEVCAVAAAVALHCGPARRARIQRRDLAARQRRHHVRDEPDYARLAGEVHRIGHVLGRVIALMRAGEEVQYRHMRGVKAGLVRWPVAVAGFGDLEIRPGACSIDEAAPFRGGVGAEGGDLVVAQRPDHVQIHHGHDARHRYRRMGDEVARASQAALLAGEEREQNCPPVRALRQRVAQQLRRIQHTGVAGSVVVRSGMNGVDVRLHRAFPAVAEVIVVRAENDDLAGQRASAGQHRRKVLAVVEMRLHVGHAVHAREEHAGARFQIGVDILLKLPQVDAGLLEPALRDGQLHLNDGNPGGALWSVVHERRNLVFSFVLQRTGDKDHRYGAALASLQDLVAHGRPAARLAAVEFRCLVFLLRLVTKHQGHFALEIDAVEIVVRDRRGVDAVTDEYQRSGKCAGAGETQGRPVTVCNALELVAAAERDAHLHRERLPVRLAERRPQSDGPHAPFDVFGG